jgi:hypothetical protein
VDHTTVVRDLNKQVVHNAPPAHKPESAPDSTSETEPVRPAPPADPPKVTGKDGKQYAAKRPHDRPASKPAVKQKTTTPEPEMAPWTDVIEHLNRLADLIQRTGSIPKELKPWSMIESLERAGYSLLQRARELRRKHNG